MIKRNAATGRRHLCRELCQIWLAFNYPIKIRNILKLAKTLGHDLKIDRSVHRKQIEEDLEAKTKQISTTTLSCQASKYMATVRASGSGINGIVFASYFW